MNTSQIIPLHKEQPDFPVNHKELAEFLGLDSETVTYYIEGKRGNFCFSNTTDFYRQVSLKTDRGRPAVIYWLTINSAKEICMLAEGDKGKQARLYFIECERVAKAPQGPTNFLEAMKLIVAKEEERLALEATVNVQAEQLAIQAPKVDAWEKLMNAEGGSNPSTASKAFTEFGIGPKSIYPAMHEFGMVFKKGDKWFAMQSAIDAGYLFVRDSFWHNPKTGKDQLTQQIYITAKGIGYLHKKLTEKELK